jgi:hypothetical protein
MYDLNDIIMDVTIMLPDKGSQSLLSNVGDEDVGDVGGDVGGDSFYKDIWQLLLERIDNPRDYRTISLICKVSSRAALQMKQKKSTEFSKVQYQRRDGVLYQKAYYLPNQQLHGKHETYVWHGDYCLTITKEFSFGSLIS